MNNMFSLRNLFKKTPLRVIYSVIRFSYKDVPLMIYQRKRANCKIEPTKIVFSSFNGTKYSAQPQWICDALMNNGKHYDIVWILPSDAKVPKGIRTVQPDTKEAIDELTSASIWVDNCRKKYWIRKKSDQLYIQTWHGPICIKAVEKDAVETLPPYYVLCAKRDSLKCDYMVAECEWRKRNIRNAFWYDEGPIIEAEFKKKEYLNPNTYVQKVREKYGFSDNEEIILYLPTFRKNGDTSCYLRDYSRIIAAAQERFGKRYRVIVRLHPNIVSQQNFVNYDEQLRNGSEYPSVEELIVASDIVISDYSGCIFESFRAGKKVFLYCEDMEKYVNEDRRMYFDMKNFPAPFSLSEEELLHSIYNFDSRVYYRKVEQFNRDVGYYDLDACNVICSLIKEKIEKGAYKK